MSGVNEDLVVIRSDDTMRGVKTAVGRQCSVTGQKISSVLDGEFCHACDVAFHRDALKEDRTVCPKCGDSFEETAARQLRSEREKLRRMEEKADTRKVWVLLGVSVGCCLLPFIIVLTRFIMEFDEPAFSARFRFRVAMRMVGDSAVAWLWVASIFMYGWALWTVVRNRLRGMFPTLFIGLIFIAVAGFMAYSWIIEPLSSEKNGVRKYY